jgi:ferredoxin
MPFVTVKVNPELCIAAANCVGIIPEVFQLDAENRATVQGPGTAASPFERRIEVSSADLERLHEAAESCPTLAITVEE